MVYFSYIMELWIPGAKPLEDVLVAVLLSIIFILIKIKY